MQFHRLASFLIGIWLGVSVFMDFVATQNFKNVSRVMTSVDLRALDAEKKAGDQDNLRMLFRYFAGEANRYFFEQWEWAELMLGLALMLVLLFGRTYQKLAMALCLMMLVLVALQRFALTPAITRLGRELEFGALPGGRFAVFHAAYGYSELAKLALGLILTARLLIRRKVDRKAFVREYERTNEA